MVSDSKPTREVFEDFGVDEGEYVMVVDWMRS
jgi:hypothetical protein